MDTGSDHDTEGGERPLDDAPLYLLRQALRTYTARWQETVRELTPPQYVALRVLRSSPDLDQAALAEATRIDTATLTPLLARLEERGYVVRRVDPGNRRRKLLRVTEGRGRSAAPGRAAGRRDRGHGAGRAEHGAAQGVHRRAAEDLARLSDVLIGGVRGRSGHCAQRPARERL
ncbi:MarR family transcriptional regulator [Amycolatopsis sp. NPDC051372]|uniref:MarR family winged helix-turn-helix transcriptional regulator n=1 Tax=Amycolatopsis sp. NPDC051372 TaxID=3155669 RepID=UPI0034300074